MTFLFSGSDDDKYSHYAEKQRMQTRLDKLETFFKAIANLTVDHDSLESNGEVHAVVFPNKLGKELEKVDPKWYENT